METWDNEPRVRPVPIEDEEWSTPDVAAPVLGSDHWTRRPWLPIALSTVAVLGVLTSVTFFGAIEQDDPPPALDARRFANVRALHEIIPDITDRITLIVVGPEGPATMLWDPSLAEPKMVEPWSKDDGEIEYDASFDSSGRYVALAASPVDAETISLRVGIPTDLGSVDRDRVGSYQWHATEVGRIAFVVIGEFGQATLYTAEVHPFSRELLDVTLVSAVDPAAQLMHWDTTGFILTGGPSSVVQALDDAGTVQWSEPGHALAASGHTIFVAPDGAGNDIETIVLAFTREGERIGSVLDEAAIGDIDLRTMTLSRNSDVSARIDVRGGATTLHVEGRQIPTIRTVQHDQDSRPLGFTSNDEFFVLKITGSNDLAFVRWNSGETFMLDIPNGYDVISLDVG